jgi:hypothetical protein
MPSHLPVTIDYAPGDSEVSHSLRSRFPYPPVLAIATPRLLSPRQPPYNGQSDRYPDAAAKREPRGPR